MNKATLGLITHNTIQIYGAMDYVAHSLNFSNILVV
jgi:hypothetical protein